MNVLVIPEDFVNDQYILKPIISAMLKAETYFQPFADQTGVSNELGDGRKILAEEAARQYNRIRQLCEEVADLESRIP